MLNQSAPHLYEYAIVRYMPCAERGEFVNIGLVMMCKRRRWIRARIEPDTARVSALCSSADIPALVNQCRTFDSISSGKPDGHPIASLPAEERFRWLTAVRSASVVTSRPHPGRCADLDSTFDRLYATLVE